ncbi:Nitrogen permease reactivator protein [Lecanora helva]
MNSGAPQEVLEQQTPSQAANPDEGSAQRSQDAASSGAVAPQAVRFASENQEIEPAHSLQTDTQTSEAPASSQPLSPGQEQEIRNLALGLHNSHIHQRRMSNFTFEPVSLPVSRAPSNESTPYHTSREGTRSGAPSPPTSTIPSPPLTPAGSNHQEKQPEASGAGLAKVHPDPMQIAPQTTGSKNKPSPTSAGTSRPSTPSEAPTRLTSMSQGSEGGEKHTKPLPAFSVGPSEGSSTPRHTDSGTSKPSESPAGPSREISPSHRPEGSSGAITPPPQRPYTPAGDRDDPYARSKRPPQSRNLDSIDKRFVFGDTRRRSGVNLAGGSTTLLPRSSSGNDLRAEHRKSTFSLHGHKDHSGHSEHHGSMSELKRFFGLGGHHKSKRSDSPAKAAKASANSSGTRTPPNPATNVPFADDHGLQTKWGKFGKVLGSGAGGSVKLMKRSSDGLTFAVKQFRDRHSYETEREYNKKVTAEFCIGSTLHHGNIIETLDIIQEKGHWYEVMEYAPYDLFAIVMTGKMSREEVACSFLQIVNGVSFLHSMGLAHRDLKLDNVVVNDKGIMKLIDFGSASVFRYPFENDVILASGVVGSDPYLAPEVYDLPKYDPQPADIWSLAIIFACMSLRRFPWKAPRITDNSYKLFTSPPTPGTPSADGLVKEKSKSTIDTAAPVPEDRSSTHHHRHHSEKSEETVSTKSHETGAREGAPKPEVIKGPWRLLRLLPRETRNIMGHMLQVNPKQRATLEDIHADAWMSGTPTCQQLEGGKVIRAEGHEHTLEPGAVTTPATSHK